MQDGWNPDRGNGLGPGTIYEALLKKPTTALVDYKTTATNTRSRESSPCRADETWLMRLASKLKTMSTHQILSE